MSENNSNQGSAGRIVTAFAIGAAIGAGLALLYAPRSGRETRTLLARKSRELKGKAGDLIDDAREFVNEKKSEISAAVDAGRDAMREERARHQRRS